MSSARGRLAAAAVLLAVSVLIGLGTWQLVRRAEKHALIARIEAQMKAPPASLPVTVADPRALDYRRVAVTGRYLYGREIRLANRVRKGVPGVHVVTPLVPDSGPTVLVDRGWAPAPRAGEPAPSIAMPSGRVTVTGIARVPAAPGAFTPANDPARELWFSLDLVRIAEVRGLGELAPVVIVADDVRYPQWPYPIGGAGKVELRDDHLGYALTWYSLAFVLMAIAVIARRRRSVSGP